MVTIYHLINACLMYVSCMSHVCLMYVSCLSHVCLMFVSCGKWWEREVNGGTGTDREGQGGKLKDMYRGLETVGEGG